MSGGILARGDSVLGGFWLGGFCPGGFCPGGFCPGGFCPGGFCPRTESNIESDILASHSSLAVDIHSVPEYPPLSQGGTGREWTI